MSVTLLFFLDRMSAECLAQDYLSWRKTKQLQQAETFANSMELEGGRLCPSVFLLHGSEGERNQELTLEMLKYARRMVIVKCCYELQ